VTAVLAGMPDVTLAQPLSADTAVPASRTNPKIFFMTLDSFCAFFGARA
jgi:hypothetical protein